MPQHVNLFWSAYSWHDLLTSNGNEVGALGLVLSLDLEASIIEDELLRVRVRDHLVTGENINPNSHFSLVCF